MLFEFGKDLSKGKWKLWLVILGAALGILLLLFGTSNQKSEASDPKPQQTLYEPTKDEMLIYQGYLEERIKDLCQSVEGVGNATVIVMLDGGFEEVYATEGSEEKWDYVIVGSGSSAHALFLSRNAPRIAGVGVVCQGGGSASVQEELTSLLSATLHLSSNRIHISEAR